MIPQRISVKYYIKGNGPVDLDPFTPLFHRFIRNASVDGLLIDVADYKHVPDGPGIVLIGHDVDYGLDLNGGPGLLVVRKRYEKAQPLVDILRDTAAKALKAIKAIMDDGSTGVEFELSEMKVSLIDRLIAPNTAESFESFGAVIKDTLQELYDAECEVRRGDGDKRKNLSFDARSPAAASVDVLLERLQRQFIAN